MKYLSSGLVAQAATTPVPLDLLATLVVVGLHGLNQLGEGGSVVGVNVGDGNAGGGLASAHSPKPARTKELTNGKLSNLSYMKCCAHTCFASFKYPSLSRDGVKRPDEVFYPGALTERHEKPNSAIKPGETKAFFHI